MLQVRTAKLQPKSERLLLTVAEAAHITSLSSQTIRLLIADGQLPVVRVRTSVRIPFAALKAWVDCRMTSAKRTTNRGGN
jgi:excisionase family DNA binding protein